MPALRIAACIAGLALAGCAERHDPGPPILDVVGPVPAEALCRGGGAIPYPPELTRGGIHMIYKFNGRIDAADPQAALAQILTAGQFKFVGILTNLGNYFAVVSPALLLTREQFAAEVAKVCGLEQTGSLRLESYRYDTRKTRAVAARRLRAANAWEAVQRARVAAMLALEAREKSERMRAPPWLKEAGDALRRDWEMASWEFRLSETTFGKAHDIECRRVRELFFTCLTGVTALSKAGPEYERAEVDFERGADGVLHYVDKPIPVNGAVRIKRP